MAYIMVVDDDEDLADATATVLRSSGHEVAIAYDTASAAENVKARIPDLLILDVMFPGDSNAGFDFARQMRHAGQESAQVPILMLTAINDESSVKFSSSDIDEAWLPVSDFLEKPVNPELLKEKVAQMLSQNER